VVLGTAAALGIARNRSALARACDVLFMSPLLLPALAFGFAALIFIHKLGFAPSIPFLVLGHIVVCVPFVLRTTIAALSQLDPALLDASYSLGGGRLMTFRRVTLPLIAPVWPPARSSPSWLPSTTCPCRCFLPTSAPRCCPFTCGSRSRPTSMCARQRFPA